MDDSTRKSIVLNTAEIVVMKKEGCSMVSNSDGTHIEITFPTGVSVTLRIVGDTVPMTFSCDPDVPEGAQSVYAEEAKVAVCHALFQASMEDLGLQP